MGFGPGRGARFSRAGAAGNKGLSGPAAVKDESTVVPACVFFKILSGTSLGPGTLAAWLKLVPNSAVRMTRGMFFIGVRQFYYY